MKKQTGIIMCAIPAIIVHALLACDKDSSSTGPDDSGESVVVIDDTAILEFYVLDTVDDRPVSYWLSRGRTMLPLLFDIHVDSLNVYSGRVYTSAPSYGWMEIDTSTKWKNKFMLVVPDSLYPVEYIGFEELIFEKNTLSGVFMYAGSTLDSPAPDFTAYKLSGYHSGW